MFQFTHPVRGATDSASASRIICAVSIHAPREGCDFPCGLGHADCAQVSIHAPREGCDLELSELVCLVDVSIHAPREGCDIDVVN